MPFGLFAIAQTGLRRRSSNARYLTGCLALALMLAAPVLTFIALGAERTVPVTLAGSGTQSNRAKLPALPEIGGGAGMVGQAEPDGPHRVTDRIGTPPSIGGGHRPPLQDRPRWLLSEEFIPGLVLAWLLGVWALLLRLLFSSLQVARWKRRGNESPGALWLERLDSLKVALQISRPVRLVQSALIEVPAVVGWLRPVILLPAATLAGLTPAQLEAILAHELAHVRRHDYLVNLLQNGLETLLFYHPAVWWVSSCVRAEREICCDEIAVKLCGDRLVYARALAALEQLRGGGRSLALGADGSSLLERIRRLSGAPSGGSFPTRRRAGGALVAALVAIILVSLLRHPSSNAKAQATTPAARNQTNVQTSIAPNPPGALNGTILLPNGEPAAGAELVLQVTNDLLWLHMPNGFLTENGMTNRPEDGARPMSAFAMADDGGHFHFPPTEYVAALLAIHREGFTWMAPSELKDNLEVRLEPLGRIEGTFLLGTRPGSNEEIMLGANEPRLHLFSDPLRTITDNTGRFVFTNLPAIQFGLSRQFRRDPPATNRGQYPANAVLGWSDHGYRVTIASRGWAMSSEHAKVPVKGGGTTEVELGGTGRPVVGKATKAGMAFDWSQAHVQLLQKSLPAPEVQRYMARIAEDGAFRVENVGAGNYDLGIYVSPDDGKSNILYTASDFLALSRKVVVPEMAGGRSVEALDLGRLEIQHPHADHRIKVGEQAPAINATNSVPSLDGGQLNLANYRGKYVLLDLCGDYFDSDLPFLRTTHDAFAQDRRLAMASVTLGYILQDGFGTARPREPELWSHAYTGPIQTADWAEAYGLLDQNSMVRQIVLIGPDGKILAKDLHGDAIKAAVAKELEGSPDSKGQTAPPLVPPSGKTNAGEKPPAVTNQTKAADALGSGTNMSGGLVSTTPAGLVQKENSTPAAKQKPAPSYADFPPELQRALAEAKQRIGANGEFYIAGRVTFSDSAWIEDPKNIQVNFEEDFGGSHTCTVSPGGWFLSYGIFARNGDLAMRSFSYLPIDFRTNFPANTINYVAFEMERVPDNQLTTIQGTVTDQTGAPLAGVRIGLAFNLAASPGDNSKPVQAARTREDGGFSFSGLAPAAYRLFANHPGRVHTGATVTTRSGAALQKNLTLFPLKSVTFDYVCQNAGMLDFTGGNLTRGTMTWDQSKQGIIFTSRKDYASDLEGYQIGDQVGFSCVYGNGNGNGFYDAGAVDFDSITKAPGTGYSMRRQPCVVGHVYVVKTYDGHYVKLVVKEK